MAEKNKVKLGDMSKGELEKLLEEKRAKMTKVRFDISSKQIKNHREHRNIKRDIARIITIMKNKQE
jgi:ribosomal protein L29